MEDKTLLTGQIDIIDKNIAYEVKCVKEHSDDHILQLALYAYLLE